MKYCGKCGTQLPDEATFCPRCGARSRSLGNTYGEPTRNYQEPPRTAQYPAGNTPYSAGLKTNRSLLKYILLSIITLGIYAIVVMTQVTNDMNTIACRYDGKKTTHYCLVFFLLGPITVGIYTLIWYHMLCERMATELRRRRIDYNFDAATFWLWGILGVLIIVGPFIFRYKFFKSINYLCADYNRRG